MNKSKIKSFLYIYFLEAVSRENFTRENVNENSIGENVGKMNENFAEKSKVFFGEIKKMLG